MTVPVDSRVWHHHTEEQLRLINPLLEQVV